MTSDGTCLKEDHTLNQRFVAYCDGLSFLDKPSSNDDDQFVATPNGGTYIPDTVHYGASTCRSTSTPDATAPSSAVQPGPVAATTGPGLYAAGRIRHSAGQLSSLHA
ncbi:hypothetical protein [Streptomyces sp. NPDC050121]|uniref:hypothetical protein n=1 Tax=Streptomyces sp. NPDC050121 TaxID=3365601 RepID=UPI0037BC9546